MALQENSSRNDYLLATGEQAATRLRLLDDIFGPATRELLMQVGLSLGLRVAEIGCGSGLVACWMAERVGPTGSVAAVDQSAEQLQVASKNARARGLRNISFHQTGAYETALPRASFDLVYSRFLMCHLTQPVPALKEMYALLKSGGLLVCEDYDNNHVASEPASQAYQRLREISHAVDVSRGLDSCIGSRLHRLVVEAGFRHPEVRLSEPAALRGDKKLFWAITLREAAPAIFAAQAATPEELESVCREMEAIAQDETTLVVLARVTQVWARK